MKPLRVFGVPLLAIGLACSWQGAHAVGIDYQLTNSPNNSASSSSTSANSLAINAAIFDSDQLIIGLDNTGLQGIESFLITVSNQISGQFIDYFDIRIEGITSSWCNPSLCDEAGQTAPNESEWQSLYTSTFPGSPPVFWPPGVFGSPADYSIGPTPSDPDNDYTISMDFAFTGGGAGNSQTTGFTLPVTSGEWAFFLQPGARLILDANGLDANPPMATPLPAPVWLLGSAIIGLIGIRRRASATAAR